MQEQSYSCAVLLCTYNGEKYLREQIDSILAQEGVNVFVYAADDCSKDKTQSILQEYKEKYSNFTFSINKVNKNFSYNFIDLLFSITDKYDYYAFADQDDVWDRDKLINAIKKINLKNSERGVLYFSNQKVVDENLNYLYTKYNGTPEKINRYTYLCENICTGCTMVMDNRFKELATHYYPNNIKLHDNYFFLLSLFCADYIYDENAYINYRQHQKNLIGINDKKKSIIKRVSNALKNEDSISIYPTEILNGYSSLINEEDKEQLSICANYRKQIKRKMQMLFSKRIVPDSNLLNFKIKVLLNLM